MDDGPHPEAYDVEFSFCLPDTEPNGPCRTLIVSLLADDPRDNSKGTRMFAYDEVSTKHARKPIEIIRYKRERN